MKETSREVFAELALREYVKATGRWRRKHWSHAERFRAAIEAAKQIEKVIQQQAKP